MPTKAPVRLNVGGVTVRTVNGFCEDSIQACNNLLTVVEVGEKISLETAEVVYDRLKTSLLFGKGEAATGLAYLHGEGLVGVSRDFEQRRLFISIGAKLEDEDCIQLMKKEEKTQDYDKVEDEAKKWVKTIKEIVGKYPNKYQELTALMRVEAKNALKAALEPNNIAANMQQKVARINATASAPTPTPKIPLHHKKKNACCITM